MTNFSMMVSALKQNIARAVVGKDDVVELMLTALLCEGHVLIEDVPGVGKTTLASALARSLSCSFKRIQFTPDITPSDITGFTMPSLSGEMQYRPGAIMSQIVLADEINRTSPKTQSALLEVMEERQVTVDGVTYPLARPFMVLATQNPVDFVGTYPLPEAQMDRFFMRISIGYPSMQDEMDILDRYCGEQKPMESVVPVCSSEDVIAMQQEVKTVYCSKEVRAYIAAICAATRSTPSVWAQARAPRLHSSTRRRQTPCSAGATISFPRMCSILRPACCVIASCFPPRRACAAIPASRHSPSCSQTSVFR